MSNPINILFIGSPNNIYNNLLKEKGITIVDTVSNFQKMNEKMNIVKVDFILVDIDFAEINFTDLKSFIQKTNMSVIAICDKVSSGFEALKSGAVDMILRYRSDERASITAHINDLTAKIKKNMDARSFLLQKDSNEIITYNKKIVLIGASTGGTEATTEILKMLPSDIPPILIVQHMPAVFTRLYAERLNESCKMKVWEARNGDIVRPGTALIGPSGMQMRIVKKQRNYYVECTEEEKVSGHCPSVDVLFESGAKVLGKNAVGVILTGMGADGARGLLEMRKNGASTIGQDQETCVVYGMPKVAFDMGGVERQLPLNQIAASILELA